MLNPGTLPARAKPEAELDQWVRRDEEYATLGANVVVELNGVPVDPNGSYRITVNSFLAEGGDNFAVLAQGGFPGQGGDRQQHQRQQANAIGL